LLDAVMHRCCALSQEQPVVCAVIFMLRAVLMSETNACSKAGNAEGQNLP